MKKYIDCAGKFPTLGAFHFMVQVDKDYEIMFFVSLGLRSVELLAAGRYRARKIQDLFKYANLLR